jgi:hypothetical protein
MSARDFDSGGRQERHRSATDPAPLDQMVALGCQDRFESRMNTQAAKRPTDMVTHGLMRNPEPLRDLHGRAAPRQKLENFNLARRKSG